MIDPVESTETRMVTITDKYAWYVNWTRFPKIAEDAKRSLKVKELPTAEPLSKQKIASLKEQAEKENRKHYYSTLPFGGKRPARRRSKIWQYQRRFNKRGRRYFKLSGIWGKGEPKPKGAYD